MSRLVRAELVRWRTARAGVALTAGALTLHVILALGGALAAGHDGNAPLGTPAGLGHVLRGGGVVTWAALLLGVVAMAGEFHHRTAATTFLVTPCRRRVLAAKVAATVGVAVTVDAVAMVLGVVASWPVHAHRGAHLDLVSARACAVVLGSIAATALLAALGVGLGALVTNQTAAVAGAIVWFAVTEGVLSVPLGAGVSRYLPGIAAEATAGGGGGRWLPAWAGALVVAGYTTVLLAAGGRRLARAEIS